MRPVPAVTLMLFAVRFPPVILLWFGVVIAPLKLVVLPRVRAPVISVVPATYNNFEGLVLPIPTLPVPLELINTLPVVL